MANRSQRRSAGRGIDHRRFSSPPGCRTARTDVRAFIRPFPAHGCHCTVVAILQGKLRDETKGNQRSAVVIPGNASVFPGMALNHR